MLGAEENRKKSDGRSGDENAKMDNRDSKDRLHKKCGNAIKTEGGIDQRNIGDGKSWDGSDVSSNGKKCTRSKESRKWHWQADRRRGRNALQGTREDVVLRRPKVQMTEPNGAH